jgi:succinate-semialdehyde dehydrogenase/glutarate-semialdehyde dehydrogenase
MKKITSYNPATNQAIKSYNLFNDHEVKKIISGSHTHYQQMKTEPIGERKPKMLKVADILLTNKKKYARNIVEEMGKTYPSAIAEVEKCAWVCRFYAEKASEFLADEIIVTDASKSMISYRPLGIILAVMPWNYPFWQVFRFAAPAIMAGNVCLLKHASNVPQCALNIQQIFVDAGFSEYVFKTLLIGSDQVEAILKNKHVKAATLTGSGPAGSAVASTAGHQIKKTVLELGGNDAYIILEDADLDHAAKQCTQSRLLNAGQSCIGAKRFIVVDSVYDSFLEKFYAYMNSATIGDPMANVDLGPLARHDLRDEVHQQVVKSVEKGAKLILGGKIPYQAGAFYPPTILTHVQKGQPAYEEEIFGPVASIIRVKDEKEAIRIANDSSFGLGSCVFTNDIDKGEHIAKYELESGSCFVNQFVKSDPRLPFGGIKTSGYGRELSYHGIREFVNIKTIYIK